MYKDTWARVLKTPEEVPSFFREFCETIRDGGRQFPYTIFCPPDRFGFRKTTPKLICLSEETVAIAEKVKHELRTAVYPLSRITYLETGHSLLYAWFTLYCPGAAALKIEYCAVVKQLFQPLFARIRAALPAESLPEPGDHQAELAKLNIYSRQNYKFMNFAKQSILPGETVLQSLLQPEVHLPYLKFFQRTLVGNHLTVLTDRELIAIRDLARIGKYYAMRYGGVWNFIPLTRIVRIQLAPDDASAVPGGRMLLLRLELEGSGTITLPFHEAQQPGLQALAESLARQCGILRGQPVPVDLRPGFLGGAADLPAAPAKQTSF
jgi:hypothetical protein